MNLWPRKKMLAQRTVLRLKSQVLERNLDILIYEFLNARKVSQYYTSFVMLKQIYHSALE